MSSCRLYLGRLSDSARERDVERFFKGYGKIREMLLKEGYGFIEFHESRDADDAVCDLNGKELCGERVVLEFAKPPGARRGGDGRMSGGRSGYGGGGGYGGGYDRGSRGGGYGGDDRYGGGYSRGGPMRPRNPPPLRTQYRVNVENLSSKISWQDLKDYMREAGEVTYADAHKLRQNEGVVEFASRKDMETAISTLDGKELNGRKIKITEDKPSGGRKRSRSRSDSRDRRSGSRSRSRSRSKGGRRSRSRSVSRGKATRKSRSRSRSRSPAKKESRKAHSRSYTPARDADKRASHSKSRSRSPLKKSAPKSRSHSRSPVRGADKRSVTRSPVRDAVRDQSRSRSRSPVRKSYSRSRSGSRN